MLQDIDLWKNQSAGVFRPLHLTGMNFNNASRA